MLVIGLTGTIGSGKSTVAGFMQEMGAHVIDADKVGHEVYLPHSLGWQKIVNAFGENILSPDKSINRQKLGEIVFNNPDALKRLNHIVHPLMLKSIEGALNELQHKHTKVVVLEAALLIETGWESLVDEIWVTIAPEDAVYKRLSTNRNLTDTQIRRRLEAHISVAQQIKYATHVIETDMPLDELKANTASLWDKISKHTK